MKNCCRTAGNLNRIKNWYGIQRTLTELIQLRTKLNSVPQILLPLLDEQEQKIFALQKQISSALDLISLEDLAERINTLSPELKQKLLSMLN